MSNRNEPVKPEKSGTIGSKSNTFAPDFNQYKSIVEWMIARGKDHGGKYVVSGYGEDPATGKKLTPFVRHIPNSGAHHEIIAKRFRDAINEAAVIPGMNVYSQLALIRDDLPEAQRGTKADITFVLGYMRDLDDGNDLDTKNLPIEPHFEVETSPGSLQTLTFFDKGYPPHEAASLVEAIIKYSGGD
jgi:hypothetical protein